MILLCFVSSAIELFILDLILFMIYLFQNLIMQLSNISTAQMLRYAAARICERHACRELSSCIKLGNSLQYLLFRVHSKHPCFGVLSVVDLSHEVDNIFIFILTPIHPGMGGLGAPGDYGCDTCPRNIFILTHIHPGMGGLGALGDCGRDTCPRNNQPITHTRRQYSYSHTPWNGWPGSAQRLWA